MYVLNSATPCTEVEIQRVTAGLGICTLAQKIGRAPTHSHPRVLSLDVWLWSDPQGGNRLPAAGVPACCQLRYGKMGCALRLQCISSMDWPNKVEAHTCTVVRM